MTSTEIQSLLDDANCLVCQGMTLAEAIKIVLLNQINGAQAKVYRALLTQSGVNAPVAIVRENTLGGTPVWSRTNIGRYTATLVGGFLAPNTFVRAIPSLPETNQAWGEFDITRTNDDTITLNVVEVDLSAPGGSYVDISALAGAQYLPIEILVYP